MKNKALTTLKKHIKKKQINRQIDKNILDLLNNQVNLEFQAAYKYFAMGNYFNDIDYDGFAAWMYTQGKEELEHMNKFNDYIIQRNARPTLLPISAPNLNWHSPLAAYEESLLNEQIVTNSIHKIYDCAEKKKDRITTNFLLWFIEEQLEEEDQVESIIERLTRAGEDEAAILSIQSDLIKMKNHTH